MNHTVSIIIPVKAINDYIRESVPKILALDWPDFEILIIPDQVEKGSRVSGLGSQVNNGNQQNTEHRRQSTSYQPLEPGDRSQRPNIRIVASGAVGPAEKRDLAAKHAKGDILAFLDDDAYPRKDWLKKAVKHFASPKVAAVGGPAVTPSDDSIGQKISGAVFESYLGGGSARNRYLPIGSYREVDDWPSVNLLVRKDVFKKIGGFDNTYWPGEDTKLCLDIINAGYKIIYEPQAIVCHHRRAGVIKHLKQIGNYALHRGYFAKKHPKNSLRLAYFVPTLFVLYLVLLVILTPPFLPLTRGGAGGVGLLQNDILLVPLGIYILGLSIDATVISLRWKNPLIGIGAAMMTVATHLCYGVRFVCGLLLPKLKR